MFDLASYPHIREQIISCLDRPALVNFARTSSSSHRAVIPYLYPTTLFDPLYTSSAAEPAPGTSSPDDQDSPASRAPSLPFERVEQRLLSLFSSPHLARSQTIIVDHAGEWAGDMVRLNEKPQPPDREDGTVTIRRVDAMVPRTTAGHLGSADWERGTEADREAVRVGKAYYYRGLVPVPRKGASSPLSMPAESVPIDRAITQYTHFQHLFDIASLLPSDQLVLYVPPNQNVNLNALVCAACKAYGPPSWSTRRLTIVAESGNEFDCNSAEWSDHPRPLSWDHIELVLIPNGAGIFTCTHRSRTPSTANVTTPGAQPPATDAATLTRHLITSPLISSLEQEKSPAFTVVGVEGVEAAGREAEDFKEGAKTYCDRVRTMLRMPHAVDLKFIGMEEWERETSVLAKCAGLSRVTNPVALRRLLDFAHGSQIKLGITRRNSTGLVTRLGEPRYLYPSSLFDPIYTSSAARPISHAYRLDKRGIASVAPGFASAEIAEQKLASLLSSPHLDRARTVIVDHPQEWARDLLQLRLKPLPAIRSEGTVTIVRVEPLLSSATGRRNPYESGSRLAVPTALVAGTAYYYPGLEPDFSVENRAQFYAHPSTHLDPTHHIHFDHLFDIASLIPSERLVLYIPFGKRINISGLISAACEVYGPQSASTRRVTILIESGNDYHYGNYGRSLGPAGRYIWQDIELVLFPSPTTGNFTFDYKLPPSQNPWSTTLHPQASNLLPEGTLIAAHDLVESPMDIAASTGLWPKTYTVVGVEGLEAAREDIEGFKKEALRQVPEKRVDMKFVALAEWEKGASILADCAGLGVTSV